MRTQRFLVLAVGMALGSGCGNSPTRPTSPPSPSSTAAAEVSVDAAIAQALAQAALVQPTGGILANPRTLPCPNGGSMIMSYTSTLPAGPSTTFSTSSRMEYRDCNLGGTTVNGDPYLQMNGEHSIGPIRNAVLTASSATIRTTGGLRFSANGVQGRVQYNCTTVLSMTYPDGGGAPQVSLQSSGTITWEQPIGSPTIRPCGPA